MSDPTPEERADRIMRSCGSAEYLSADNFEMLLTAEIRAAEASALRRAAEWVDVDPQRPAPGIADWLREQADRVESDSR